MLRGNESNTQHALPQERKRAKGNNDATQVQMRSQVDHRQVSGQVRRAELQTEINSGERAFYYRSDMSIYGTRCCRGEKAERDFNAHRIDEDGF